MMQTRQPLQDHFSLGWLDVQVYPGQSQFPALCPVSQRISALILFVHYMLIFQTV